MRASFIIFTASLLCAIAKAGFPSGGRVSATRDFYDTPHGQIHYAYNLATGTAPLVLFHSHPRSIAEFKYVLQSLGPSTNFVAFDYFGFGSSDECLTCDAAQNEYVSIAQFAKYASAVLTKLGVKQYVPTGTLKGASIATNLAANDKRASRLILANAAYWLPDVEAKIRSYMSMIKNPVLYANGAHLITVWNDSSASPKPYLPMMEEKTVDELRAYFSGWQYVLAELDNNNNTLPEMKRFTGKTLLLWGKACLARADSFGFHTAQYTKMIEDALQHEEIHELEYGNEGMMASNHTEIAQIIQAFLKN